MITINKIKPVATFAYKSILIIYSVLVFTVLSLIGLVFFDVLTADNLNITAPIFSILYLKLKCGAWLLFFIGILFLMVTSKDCHAHAMMNDSSESGLFFILFVSVLMAVFIFQPLPVV